MILNTRLVARRGQVEERIALYERIWSSAKPCGLNGPAEPGITGLESR